MVGGTHAFIYRFTDFGFSGRAFRSLLSAHKYEGKTECHKTIMKAHNPASQKVLQLDLLDLKKREIFL